MDIDVSGKRVFLRGDLDVGEALKAEGLTTNARLQNLKPTVEYLISHNVKQIIIAGHIGRPSPKATDGKSADREKLSTRHLIEPLEKILGRKITFQEDVIASEAKQSELEIASSSHDSIRNDGERGNIVLLENLRFWEEEEENDPDFAKQLASTADIYINEAFGVSHRAHASIVGVPGLLPHGAGLHLEEEVNQLTRLLRDPQRPMMTVIGGAKLETKIPVIESMSKVADFVLVGGVIAKEITNYKFQITKNVVVAELTEDTKDINEESIEKFQKIIKGAKTVVWNGPMGYFEGGFERGTIAIAQSIIDSGAYSVIGGGETVEFLSSKNLLDKFSFVSSGGGAMLEFLAGNELPGIKALG